MAREAWIYRHRRPAGPLASSLVAAVLCVSTVACGSPVGISQPCTVVIDGMCWMSLGLESEWVREIAVTPWGTFVGTEDAGIFRLESDGRWTALGPDTWHGRLIPLALAYLDSTPPRLLVGVKFLQNSQDTTFASVYATFDRGETWIPHDGGLAASTEAYLHRVFVDDLEVDPGDPNRVFMSTCHGVLRSDDAGETWEFVYGGFDFCLWFVDVLVDPARTGRLWVIGQGNIPLPFVGYSLDWGEHWTFTGPTCDGSLFEMPTYTIAQVPNHTDRLILGAEATFRSENGGAAESWNCIPEPQGATVGLAELGNALFAATALIDVDLESDGTLTERSTLGLYRTTDGVNWESLAVPTGTVAATTAAPDSAGGRILIGTRSGIWAVVP